MAGWYMIDVESHERAVELAAYVSHQETTMPKYLLLRHHRGGPEPHRPVAGYWVATRRGDQLVRRSGQA